MYEGDTSFIFNHWHAVARPQLLGLVPAGASLVIRGLRPHLPVQGLQAQSLLRQLRVHLPLTRKTKQTVVRIEKRRIVGNNVKKSFRKANVIKGQYCTDEAASLCGV